MKAYYSQHVRFYETDLGREEVGRGLTASLKYATFFFFFLSKTLEDTPSPTTMNTELAHLGTCPSVRSGEWVNAFWKRGLLDYLITVPQVPIALGSMQRPQCNRRDSPLRSS